MKNLILIIPVLLSTILFAQENETKKTKEKRTSFFLSTSHGVSFVQKEAWSNTRDKTYPLKPGYAFAISSGISIKSKNGKSFSDIKLTYRSYGNGISNAVSPTSVNGLSSKTSRDRFNYLGIGYQYNRYIFKIKEYNTFISAGVELSYILNRKMKLRGGNSDVKITEKGKNISNNFVISTPPTFSLGYGIDLGKGIASFGKTSRVSLNLTMDQAILRRSSPSNQYIGTMLKYQLVF